MKIIQVITITVSLYNIFFFGLQAQNLQIDFLAKILPNYHYLKKPTKAPSPMKWRNVYGTMMCFMSWLSTSTSFRFWIIINLICWVKEYDQENFIQQPKNIYESFFHFFPVLWAVLKTDYYSNTLVSAPDKFHDIEH